MMKKILVAGALVLAVAAVVFGWTWSVGMPGADAVAGWTWSV